jgi:hypothetical protein
MNLKKAVDSNFLEAYICFLKKGGDCVMAKKKAAKKKTAKKKKK